jgi:CheY-like chemotaxis protein
VSVFRVLKASVKSKTILVFRDRPRLQLRPLAASGIRVLYVTSIQEARKEFERQKQLDAIVVDALDGVERALEFCEIVHVNRPLIPILFVRSSHRTSLEPYCAAKVLDPEISEDELSQNIIDLLLAYSAPGRKQA